MKKILILLGASIMALTLTACDGDKTTTKAENATTSENSTTGGNGTSTGGENGTTNSTTTPSTTEPTTTAATQPFSITINDIKDFYGNKLRFSKVHLIDAQGAILKTKEFNSSNPEKIKFENLTAGEKYSFCLEGIKNNHINPTNKCNYFYNGDEFLSSNQQIKLINSNLTLNTIKTPKNASLELSLKNDFFNQSFMVLSMDGIEIHDDFFTFSDLNNEKKLLE